MQLTSAPQSNKAHTLPSFSVTLCKCYFSLIDGRFHRTAVPCLEVGLLPPPDSSSEVALCIPDFVCANLESVVPHPFVYHHDSVISRTELLSQLAVVVLHWLYRCSSGVF
ncbi:hypothetical protein EVAR_23304_1 [Eumeta japonica]|uniref:Uncharacterized protein n=1 Tax=Eumeta variegata TaxID=151549 RepID=A0A4C1V6R8_EUMVA|nr:hypothetical protein EVAR_23304_1 [Eumeta japonica]